MKTTCHARAASVLVLATLLSACGGGGGGGERSASAFHALADATPTASAGCTSGALTLRIGLDANANGRLDAGEVSYTELVCPDDGPPWRVEFVDEPAGANCPAGGRRALVGRDIDRDGTLAVEEASSSTYLCNGREGAQGTPGSQGPTGDDGLNSLLAIAAEPAGANCAAGGSRVQSGLDADRDGILAPGEVLQTAYVCRGEDGATGPAGNDGFDTLLETQPESPGGNCTHGGTRVRSGRDDDRDGVLDPGEIAHTAYVCNAPPAGLAWRSISADTAAEANAGYLVTGGAEVTVTLPDNPPVGSVVRIHNLDLGSWRLAQREGQTVQTRGLPLSARWNGPWIERRPSTAGDFYAVASSADGRKLVAGNLVDGVFTSNDFGETWTHSLSLPGAYSVGSSADGMLLVAGSMGNGFRHSVDSGATWQTMYDEGRWYVGVAANGTYATVAENGGRLRRTDNKGQGWSLAGPTANWRAVALSADGQIQLAGATLQPLYLSTNFGRDWAALATKTDGWTHVAMSADGSRMVAAGAASLYISTDFGQTWIDRGPPGGSWYALAMSTDGRVIVAGEQNGNLWVSEDYGATFTIREMGAERFWRAAACSADCGRIIASARLDNPLLLSPRTTFTGTGHGLTGGVNGMVELQYLGGGTWHVTAQSGELGTW